VLKYYDEDPVDAQSREDELNEIIYIHITSNAWI
jgi:hypothetical protein